MNYITEAKRLGIRIPFSVTEDDNVRLPAVTRPGGTYDNGMCITNCPACRTVRNEVRAALAAEQAQALADWGTDDLDWEDMGDCGPGCWCGEYDGEPDAEEEAWQDGFNTGFEAGKLEGAVEAIQVVRNSLTSTLRNFGYEPDDDYVLPFLRD